MSPKLRYQPADGLVAVFWTGPIHSRLYTEPWPTKNTTADWVGVFDRRDNRCLVVAATQPKTGGGRAYIEALALEVESLGFQVTGDPAAVPGPFGAVQFDVQPTAAAMLPDVTTMPYRPDPITLPTSTV